MERAVQMPVNSFLDFQEQCIKLRAALIENDALEKRKRRMLGELQIEFRGDRNVRPIFRLLGEAEDVSDMAEPVWRGMIACSEILASSEASERDQYQAVCIEPAQRQLVILQPRLTEIARDLQQELRDHGAAVPPEILELAH